MTNNFSSNTGLVHILYQEVVSEEFWQLQTDDVIIKRKKVESPFVSGHICGEAATLPVTLTD